MVSNSRKEQVRSLQASLSTKERELNDCEKSKETMRNDMDEKVKCLCICMT